MEIVVKCIFSMLIPVVVIGLGMGGCSDNASQSGVIHSTPVLIPTAGQSFVIDPPIKKTKRRLDIHVELVEDWEIKPPYDAIIIDSEEIAVTAELHASDGSVQVSNGLGASVGSGKKYLRFDFDDVSSGVDFNKVVFVPTSQIKFKLVTWRNWSPK